LEIDKIRYLTVIEAITLHILLMQSWQEVRFGVDRKDLLESALARPQQSSAYENSDLIRQAATMCFGLIKNHPWLGGNKRTASFLMETFLEMNDLELIAENKEIVELVLAIEADLANVDEIENWLRKKVINKNE
jgi:death on curing protein